MPIKTIYLCSIFLLTSCGFRGDLYLPQDNDPATFGVFQTGIGMKPPTTDKKENSEDKKENSEAQTTGEKNVSTEK